jgi:hypothetical protein
LITRLIVLLALPVIFPLAAFGVIGPALVFLTVVLPLGRLIEPITDFPSIILFEKLAPCRVGKRFVIVKIV